MGDSINFKKTIAVALLQVATLGSARSLWSAQPATYAPQSSDETILKTTYPIGNGRLGAMPFGPPGAEKLSLNVDSLWNGGPFESADYTGGNPSSSKAGALAGIRSFIFDNGSGNVTALYGSGDHYGSYRAMGNISIVIDHGEQYKDYKRTLDLSRGIYATTYSVDKVKFTTSMFCSYPAQACVFNVASTSSLPKATVKFENLLVEASLARPSCSGRFARLSGTTQSGPPDGMMYEARAMAGDGATATCLDDGTLTMTPSKGSKSLTIVFSANTNYDQKKGNAQNNYSFKGADPGPGVEAAVSKAARTSYKDLLSRHVSDYTALFAAFSLDLPDPNGSADKDTASAMSQYSVDGKGDPFVEGLLFDYSRYMLITSSRDNSLPANLQGRWAEQLSPAWSADYHANINLQMNYWAADQTGLTKTQPALWNYMQDTWVPRGTETARLLYNASGWVTHSEMNIFGHTAMKDDATWADYPASAAWMMQHVWDNFDYGRNASWLQAQGYPLIKGVAQFWISQLQDDAFSKDGTLVVNPCNSPEHGPTTFGCAHFQQVIHQVFEAVLASGEFVRDKDAAFKNHVTRSLASLDKGLHLTTWGGVKEWKVPDSYGFDAKNTHRHLSHLVGWHPGYSISSFQGGYTNGTIQKAVAETLRSRGPGNADDANSGWEKVWRAACWARLNNTEEAYYELRYAIDTNFANNGFSMYSALSAPFQIDANFGLAGAMLSMLVVDLPQRHGDAGVRKVVLGPAIPAAWGGGSVKGLRLRGGYAVDFAWDANGMVNAAKLVGHGKPVKLYNVDGQAL